MILKKRFKDRDFFAMTRQCVKNFLIFAQIYKQMKKILLTLLMAFLANLTFADSLLIEGFEYANHDLEKPVGWICDDNSWLCGYLEKDHNRIPHTGNWYAFSDAEDAWMYMPLYLIQSMKYRFTCWAISDTDLQLEFWAGSTPHPDDMHTLLLSETVADGAYEKYSSYVETIPDSCEYIAIHVIGQQGHYLTIDDIEIDMVEQYSFEAEAITGDTAMYPGSQATFRFLIHNTGYDPVDVTVHPSNDYFTDFSFFADGLSGSTFPTQPDEIVRVTAYATLRPEIEPGTVTWLDILMTIPCGCNTAMVTFWVTPLDPTQVIENHQNISVFPNPASDFVTIEAKGLQQVTLFDMSGRMLNSISVIDDKQQLDLRGLPAGTYFIMLTTETGSKTQSIIKK